MQPTRFPSATPKQPEKLAENAEGGYGHHQTARSVGSPHKFVQAVAADWPPGRWQDTRVVVAVSGGADSVALLRALHTLAGPGPRRLSVAHFNHHLRGSDSDADQVFVAELCDRLDLDFHSGDAVLGGATGGIGLEAWARTARYTFLQELAERLGARYVATAHTADDQAETILHRILRGTSLAGLAGIPARRALGTAVTLVRPLLGVTRVEVLDYLRSLEQPFCEDASNADWQFTRNRIRQELLPLIQRQYSASAAEALVRLSALAADASRVIQRLSDALLESSLLEAAPQRVILAWPRLLGQDRHLVRELFALLWRRQGWPLRDMGCVEWNRLADMALAPTTAGGAPSKQMLPGGISIEQTAERLVIEAPAEFTRL